MSGDERERAILESTRKLLRDHTLHEVSIDDITGGAGISRPAFYFYFASKDDVLLALLTRLTEQARADRDAAVERAGEDEPVTAWRDSLRTFFHVWRDNRDLFRSVDIARATSPAVGRLWSQIMEALIEDTAEAITGERERGAAPAGMPARELAICLNLMSERVFGSVLSGDSFGLTEEAALDTLLAVHLRLIYGGDPVT